MSDFMTNVGTQKQKARQIQWIQKCDVVHQDSSDEDPNDLELAYAVEYFISKNAQDDQLQKLQKFNQWEENKSLKLTKAQHRLWELDWIEKFRQRIHIEL